jgi:hypothetical protein
VEVYAIVKSISHMDRLYNIEQTAKMVRKRMTYDTMPFT